VRHRGGAPPQRLRAAPDPLFDRVTAFVTVALERVIVACLGLMMVLVFGNVVLRYGFDSGIAVSEEVSRLLFVWLVFLGAILASREHAHLGVDSVVRRLSAHGRKVCVTISAAMMLGCCAIFFVGAWRQTGINLGNSMPVSDLSYAWLYAVGLVFAVGMAISIAYNVFVALCRTQNPADLILVRETEEHLPEEPR